MTSVGFKSGHENKSNTNVIDKDNDKISTSLTTIKQDNKEEHNDNGADEMEKIQTPVGWKSTRC